MHGHYTSAEIEAAYGFAEACGYGVLSTESPWIHREGVLWNALALGPSLFHWESQSTTTASSPTGQRYIHHAIRGSRVLLFVREQRKQDGRPGAPPNPSCASAFRATKAMRVSGRWRFAGGWSGRSRRRGYR